MKRTSITALVVQPVSEEEMSAVKESSPKNKKTATQTLVREVVAEMHVNFDDYAERLSEAVVKGDAMYIEQLPRRVRRV